VPARARALLLALPFLLAGGCTRSPGEERHVLVFAAASLVEPFQALAAEFERQHPGTRIDLHFAGTAQLVMQIQEGAPADVLAAADVPSMQRVEAAGLVRSPARIFARNRLAIVTPRGNPRGIRGLEDLARPDLAVLLCGPEVPAGRYAREVLARASLGVHPVSDEPSVKAVVSKVQLGEADAGIVYVTDAASARELVDTVDLPDAHNTVASYPVAVLSGGGAPELAAELVAQVLSPGGQSILQRCGFLPP